ncbi:hypothetical protein [Paenibacillus sp. Soil766]|uniref:hypothetical protein n=1 Tax=Paenibacillus sp. Soil766 TaxID=1736404 RepID=UPI0012F93793|nr:hypothetical protein [Paenibacillus sp. Soil766]
MKKGLSVLMLLLCGLLLLTGCGDADEKTITLPVGKGGEKVTLTASESIPEQFPKSIPIAKDAEVQSAISTKEAIIVMYDVRTDFKEIMKLYKDYYKSSGYTDLNETIIEDSYTGSGLLNGSKLLVTISTPNPDATSVVLTYQNKE